MTARYSAAAELGRNQPDDSSNICAGLRCRRHVLVARNLHHHARSAACGPAGIGGLKGPRPSLMAGLTMIFSAIFIAGTAINTPATDTADVHVLVQPDVVGLPDGDRDVAVVCASPHPFRRLEAHHATQFRLAGWTYLASAMIFYLVGTFTDLILRPVEGDASVALYHVLPQWPGFLAYDLFVMSDIWLCVLILSAGYSQTQSTEFKAILRWLLWGGAIFAAAATVRMHFVNFPRADRRNCDSRRPHRHRYRRRET